MNRTSSEKMAGGIEQSGVEEARASMPKHTQKSAAATSGDDGSTGEDLRQASQLISAHPPRSQGAMATPRQIACSPGRATASHAPHSRHPPVHSSERPTGSHTPHGGRPQIPDGGGTFTGPAGRWRAYDQREVDAYHGLLNLRYGPMAEVASTRHSVASRRSFSGGVGLENRHVRAASNARQPQPNVIDINNPARPLGQEVTREQTSGVASQEQAQEQQGSRSRSPAKRYSCYMCDWTGLGIPYVRNHMLRRHGMTEAELDHGRIQASMVECLW